MVAINRIMLIIKIKIPTKLTKIMQTHPNTTRIQSVRALPLHFSSWLVIDSILRNNVRRVYLKKLNLIHFIRLNNRINTSEMLITA